MPAFDDSGTTAARQLEPLTYTFRAALEAHVSTSNYLVSLESIKTVSDIETFHHNNNVWEATITQKRLYHGLRIRLDSFFLFEWFPRAPGLYWTSSGKRARADAKGRIIKVEQGLVVYSPYGKQSMLDGGLGNIRLSPINLQGEEFVLMSASANGVCHQGYPVALPLPLYAQYINEIRERGAVVCSLVGQLKIIPNELADIYSGYTDVPKLYLQVEEATLPDQRKSRSIEDLEVSVAVSFRGKVEMTEGIYATYASFDPSNRHGLIDAVNWMRDEYVESYEGIILTDFDQQENHFPEAKFSLNKVMNLELKKSDFNLTQINIQSVDRFIAVQATIKSETNYVVRGGNVGALGDNARADNFTQNTKKNSKSRNRKPSRKE